MAVHNPYIKEALFRMPGVITFVPQAADDDYFKVSTAPTAGSSTTTTCTTFTLSTSPGLPVVPVIVTTEGTGDTFTGVTHHVIGVDQFGETIAEDVTATNSSGTWTGTCVNAYRKLISVTIAIVGTVASDDRYKIGFAKTYGLCRKIAASGDVPAGGIQFNGAIDAATVSAVYNTITLAGTPDAAKVAQWYVAPSEV